MSSDAAAIAAWPDSAPPSAASARVGSLARTSLTASETSPEYEPLQEAAAWRAVLSKCRRRCGRLSIRHRASLLTILAAAEGIGAGVVIGMAHGHWLWLLVPCVMALALTLAAVQWCIGEPMAQLVHRLEILARGQHVAAVKALPIDRADELGRLARAVSAVCLASIRHEHEARRLRRTLDSHVVQATRRATRQLERLTVRDPLTGLGNRRLLDAQLQSLAEACLRDQSELVCVLMDLDNFKQVNDQLGHAVGDELLSLVGGLIIASVRSQDLAVRLGGDEFVVLIPDTSVQRAANLVNHLRDLLRQQVTTLYPQGPWADLSAGIAAMRRDGCEDGNRLMILADQNLYAAKRGGKGCTRGEEA